MEKAQIEFRGPFAEDVKKFADRQWIERAFPDLAKTGVSVEQMQRTLMAFFFGMQWMVDRAGGVVGEVPSDDVLYPNIYIGDHTAPDLTPLDDIGYYKGSILLPPKILQEIAKKLDDTFYKSNCDERFLYSATWEIEMMAFGVEEMFHHLQAIRNPLIFEGVNHFVPDRGRGYSSQPHEVEAMLYCRRFLQELGVDVSKMPSE